MQGVTASFVCSFVYPNNFNVRIRRHAAFGPLDQLYRFCQESRSCADNAATCTTTRLRAFSLHIEQEQEADVSVIVQVSALTAITQVQNCLSRRLECSKLAVVHEV